MDPAAPKFPVWQGSPCGFKQPHLLPYTRSFFPVTSGMAPDVVRPWSRRPRDRRAEQSGRWPGMLESLPRHSALQASSASLREGGGLWAGTRGRKELAEEGRESRDGGPSYRSHGGGQEPTAASVLRKGRGQLWENWKQKSQRRRGRSGRAGRGCACSPGKLGASGNARYGARRGRSSRGKLAREALAAHVLRPPLCDVWATPAAAGTGQIERSLQNWRALQNCQPEKWPWPRATCCKSVKFSENMTARLVQTSAKLASVTGTGGERPCKLGLSLSPPLCHICKFPRAHQRGVLRDSKTVNVKSSTENAFYKTVYPADGPKILTCSPRWGTCLVLFLFFTFFLTQAASRPDTVHHQSL
jgi:hypothetical protein